MSPLERILKTAILFSFAIYLAEAYAVNAADNNSQTVRVKIGTILANNESDDIDPKLKAMRNQLKVMKYRSYRLLKEETQDVAWQGNAVFDIPGGRSLVVAPQEFRDRQIALKVRLQHGDKPVLDTTVRMKNGGNFLLGGPPHEAGVLVLSISATTR